MVTAGSDGGWSGGSAGSPSRTDWSGLHRWLVNAPVRPTTGTTEPMDPDRPSVSAPQRAQDCPRST